MYGAPIAVMMKHGKDYTFNRGATFDAFIDSAVMIAPPIAAAQPAIAARPSLNEAQIKQAIAYGARFKTEDEFFKSGIKGVRIKLASAMAMDGISKYATFFDDWNVIAAKSAAANQQMRELNPIGIQSKGLLHVIVEIHARGTIGNGKLSRRYGKERAHLVLKIGERVVQPLAKGTMYESGGSTAGVLLGGPGWSGKTVLDFAFDVLPSKHEGHDPEFDTQIRNLRPDWFVYRNVWEDLIKDGIIPEE